MIELSPEEQDDLKFIFDYIDTDKNGLINTEELIKLLQEMSDEYVFQSDVIDNLNSLQLNPEALTFDDVLKYEENFMNPNEEEEDE